MKNKPLNYFLILVILILASIITFYNWTANQAKQEAAKRNLPEAQNSIKHAFAAGEVYMFLQNIGIGGPGAEFLTLELGLLNEKMEFYFKPNRDSTKEIMKDLYNNVSGTTVASICGEKYGYKERLNLIGSLVEKGTIPRNRDDIKIPNIEGHSAAKKSDLIYAVKWFNNNRLAIRAKIKHISDLDEKSFCNY